MISFDYQKHEQNATAFLKEVARELDTENLDQTGRVLIAVLHALRDRIMPQESLDLISQLPVFIKAAYVDGWKIHDKVERLKSREEFAESIRRHARSGIKGAQSPDFGNDEDVQIKVEAVFHVLGKHVSEGEIKDIKAQLPEPLAGLLEV